MTIIGVYQGCATHRSHVAFHKIVVPALWSRFFVGQIYRDPSSTPSTYPHRG